ncbi:hypothetical protein GRX66_08185, partial [Halobacterium sp. PCN9]|nr:hypothetical protein [Halobacterium bonnevillei]
MSPVVTGAPSSRGVGVTETLAGSLPEALVPVVVALTFLGSTWFLTTVGPAVYLFGPRRDWVSRRNGARLLAVSIGALAVVVLSKGLFAEPRPTGVRDAESPKTGTASRAGTPPAPRRSTV